MIEFLNPFEYMIEAFKALYPEVYSNLNLTIQFHPELAEGVYGEAIFDSEGVIKCINIDYNLSVENATEILAHELAHIIYPEDDHGDKWDKCFSDIMDKAMEIQIEKVGKGEI